MIRTEPWTHGATVTGTGSIPMSTYPTSIIHAGFGRGVRRVLIPSLVNYSCSFPERTAYATRICLLDNSTAVGSIKSACARPRKT